MSATNIRELKHRHAGDTIYVLASGASMNFIAAAFFVDKIVIGVNQVWREFPCSYVLQHHHEHAQDAIDAGEVLVVSDYDCGIRSLGARPLSGDFYSYRHPEQRHIDPDFDVWPLAPECDDALIMTSCTTAEAVQLAVHLGAASVVIVGADGGSLDGKLNYDGYNGGGGTQPIHLGPTYPILLGVVNHFRALGIQIYSLSPFVDLGLEGHAYNKRLAAMALVNVDGAYAICKTCNRVVMAGDVDANGNCSTHAPAPDAHLGAVEAHEPAPVESVDMATKLASEPIDVVEETDLVR